MCSGTRRPNHERVSPSRVVAIPERCEGIGDQLRQYSEWIRVSGHGVSSMAVNAQVYGEAIVSGQPKTPMLGRRT